MPKAPLVVLMLFAGCSDPPAPPPLAPPVVPPPPPAAPVDAGPPAAPKPAKPTDTLDGQPTEGVPDDPALDVEDLRDANLQQLLLRDPDRAIRVLEAAPTPSAFHVAILANLALLRRVEGPRVENKDPPLPDVPASGAAVTGPGPAFVGVNELGLKAGKRLVATLPAGLPVSVVNVSGATANVTVDVATRADFGATGALPTAVAVKTLSGVLPLEGLVTASPDVDAIAALAEAQDESDLGRDTALVLRQRIFLIAPSETARERLLVAAWRARRPSRVAAAALEPIWVTARSARLAWACKGAVAKAKWSPPTPKPPADACFTGVDVRHACGAEVPAAIVRRQELLTSLGVSDPAPVLEFVADTRRARRALVVSLPIRPTNECEHEDEHKLDPYGATVRRLQLPFSVGTLTVSVPVTGWHGVEHSVVGAQSEPKARDWLRSRVRSKWTFDARGEPSPSLGVGDVGFRLERDVDATSIGRLPQLNCDLCGGSDFR